MVYAIAGFYLMFYVAMGSVMTWAFFFWMFVIAVGSAFLARHMLNFHKGSGRAVFLYLGLMAFVTVILGGYVREAGRPRFVDRVSHYDNVYVPQERSPYLFVPVKPEDIAYIINHPKLASLTPVKFFLLRGRETLYGFLPVAATHTAQR